MKRILSLVILALATLGLTACPRQQTIAGLVNVLGNAAGTIADLEGNPALGAKLRLDTQAAATAVLNWKKGTPSQVAIEAMNLVEADLNLFPIASKYVLLIDLAIGTAETIITMLGPDNPAVSAQAPNVRRVHLENPPKTAAEFKLRWNKIALSDANTSAATIK